MKFNVLFGPGEVDFFTSNIVFTENLLEMINDPRCTRLTYTFNDKPLTHKFIEKFQDYRQQQIKNFKSDKILNYHYNYYPMISAETLLNAKQQMNDTLDELKTLGYGDKIPDWIYLNKDVNDAEHDKLNELHYVFETELIQLEYKKTPNYDRLYKLFEAVNNLVHFIELTPQTEDQWRHLHKNSNFNMAIRTNSLAEYYRLQPEDYADFGQPLGGDLVADFSTVGKDLFVCSCTNDMELVRRNSVHQQLFLTDYTFLMFSTHTVNPWFKKNHYEWCEKNKVDEYIPYREPMYNPGRHVLGKNDQGLVSGNDFYEHVVRRTPSLIGTFLSDDDGNPIGF